MFWVRCEVWVKIYFYLYMFNCLASFVKKKNEMSIIELQHIYQKPVGHICVAQFWVLYSISLIYMFILH